MPIPCHTASPQPSLTPPGNGEGDKGSWPPPPTAEHGTGPHSGELQRASPVPLSPQLPVWRTRSSRSSPGGGGKSLLRPVPQLCRPWRGASQPCFWLCVLGCSAPAGHQKGSVCVGAAGPLTWDHLRVCKPRPLSTSSGSFKATRQTGAPMRLHWSWGEATIAVPLPHFPDELPQEHVLLSRSLRDEHDAS